MPKICILDKGTNKCINILDLEQESDWKDHAHFIKSPRHDGNVGWILMDNGEWNTGILPETQEQKIQKIKARRNKYLTMTDKYILEDFPISQEEKNEWKIYRQLLRDITIQQNYPDEVVWPNPPNNFLS